MAAQRVLDQIQSLAALAAFDPGRHASELADELPADLAASDAALVTALARIDDLAQRVMRLRLEHALADDSSIGAPTRRVFATTVAAYAGKLPLLEARVREVAARGGARDADAIAARVVEAAHETLVVRATLQEGVLRLAGDRAAAAVADADRRAKDRTLDDAERRRWSATRRELEAIAADPARIVTAPWATRLASWPEQLDEPDVREVTRAELLELD